MRLKEARRAAYVALLAALVFTPAPASASPALRYRNPLRDIRTGKPLSCPDPHVARANGGSYRYVMVCTTDHDTDGIALYESRDLVHWKSAGDVFPKGRQPWWSRGRFWAPEIYRIRHRWVVYFSASVDGPKTHLPVKDGAMVLGVASSATLPGPWRTRILQYHRRGAGPGGGAIDPSVVRSPLDHQLYLFWARQTTQLWAARLSPDGLAMGGGMTRVVGPSEPWECHPNCTIEGPEPFYRGSELNLLYSAASTWDGSYKLGLAKAASPLTSPYRKLNQPVLRSGDRFIAPGHCSQPVVGPDGRTYILYHALTAPDPKHISSKRVLMIARLAWRGDQLVINGNGRAP